jgi:hypothetical protein
MAAFSHGGTPVQAVRGLVGVEKRQTIEITESAFNK